MHNNQCSNCGNVVSGKSRKYCSYQCDFISSISQNHDKKDHIILEL